MQRDILAILLLAPWAAAQTPSGADLAARLTANNLKADVSFLASDALQGRGTPSPGLDIAAEFVASQFRGAGLDPAGDDGYFQTAPYSSVTGNRDRLRLSVMIGGKTSNLPLGGDSAGVKLSVETLGKTLDAPAASIMLLQPAAVDLHDVQAIFVDSLQGLTPDQTRGKVIILTPARPARSNPAILARLQPALVIGFLPTAPNAAAAAAPQLRAESATASAAVLVWDAALRDAFTDAKPGETDVRVTAHIAAPTIEPVKLRNVIGVLRGSDPALRDTYIFVTGHYDHLGVRGTGPGDHIYNGANDDASGTSSVIEIARTLASFPSRPKRSIVFVALFGEELGLLGSRYYAQHPVFPLAKTVADFNLEHMGRTDTNEGPHEGVLNATGFDFTDLTSIFAQAGGEFGIKLVKDEQNSDPFFARSDNQAFADAGIPSTTFSVGYIFPDYHQPGDEWPKLNYENMAKTDRALALGLWRIADSTDVPHWNAANPKTEPYRKAAAALAK